MPPLAPQTNAKSPAQLGNMPLRGKNMTEDVANWAHSAHSINIAMSLEQHAFAVLLRTKMRAAVKGINLDRFQASQAARRATRPLMRAASQSDAAAKSNLRFWRAYTIVAAELQAAKRAASRTRR